MTKLLDDEVEEDEQFWNQEALKEVCFVICILTLFQRLGMICYGYQRIYNGTIRFVDKQVMRYYFRNFCMYVVIYISLYFCYLQEEHDDEYEAEREVADEFDSDFNDDVFMSCLSIEYFIHQGVCSQSIFKTFFLLPFVWEQEPEPDAVAQNEKEERCDIFQSSSYDGYYVYLFCYNFAYCCRDLPKKRLIYPGKIASKKKKKKTKVVSKLQDIPGDEKPGEELGSKEQDEKEENEAQEDMEGEKVIRKSTRTSVVVRQAERDALRAAIQATTKVFSEFIPIGYALISFSKSCHVEFVFVFVQPIQRKKVGEEKRMTQEEMLLEAAQTGLDFMMLHLFFYQKLKLLKSNFLQKS